MANDDIPVDAEYFNKIADALIEVLRQSTSPDMQQAQLILMRRLALSGDVFPSRIPPPRNITEVGGYLNLLETLQQTSLRDQALAATLGVAGPNPPSGWFAAGPLLSFVSRMNDRPGTGAAQAAISTSFTIRGDFAVALDVALATLHDVGCTLPIASPMRGLPPATLGTATPSDLLRFLGRTLDLVPSCCLGDVIADPLLLGHDASDPQAPDQIFSRSIAPTAPKASTLAQSTWAAWQLAADGTASRIETDVVGSPTASILSQAGWYRLDPIDTAKLRLPQSWARFVNVTGLVASVTKLGDELGLLYRQEEIAASSLRDITQWTWNGRAFAAPI